MPLVVCVFVCLCVCVQHYTYNLDLLVYLCDSNDRCRIGKSRNESFEALATLIVGNEDLQNVPLVLVATKQDLPNTTTTTANPCNNTDLNIALSNLNWRNRTLYNRIP